jgi:DNA (cytosine-5)-methyltransferase 1
MAVRGRCPGGPGLRPNAFRYLSVCSGIEAATVAWHPLGWEAAAFSEIEAFPRAVLAHHYPDTPLHGDFTTIGADEYGAIDLLVGGTPCQSFSVAGLRKGLADERGNLALEYLRLADRLGARWLVWENVPGVLSSSGGRDFGAFLGGLAQLGYGFAYRVLDAQFFGVPQRRRRVFVVGYLGDWRRAAAVLFERHSLSGNPAPRREKGQRIANAITERPDRGGGNSEGQRLIPSTGDTSHCLNAGGMGRQDYETETLIAAIRTANTGANGHGISEGLAHTLDQAQGQCIAFSAKDHGADAQTDLSPTLRAGGHSGSHANGGVMPAVAFGLDIRNTGAGGNIGWHEGEKPSITLDTSGNIGVAHSAVRRLTPRECERLQGFPDDYTLIPYRGKQAADGPRYKALGNSMAVPVMAWIGERIAQVEELQTLSEAA